MLRTPKVLDRLRVVLSVVYFDEIACFAFDLCE